MVITAIYERSFCWGGGVCSFFPQVSTFRVAQYVAVFTSRVACRTIWRRYWFIHSHNTERSNVPIGCVALPFASLELCISYVPLCLWPNFVVVFFGGLIW